MRIGCMQAGRIGLRLLGLGGWWGGETGLAGMENEFSVFIQPTLLSVL